MEFEKVREYIDRVMVGEKGVPGVDITVMQEHKLFFRHRSGNAAAGSQYFLYSCTKPVTVSLIMHLIEGGKLSLQDPVAEYLPAFSRLFLEKDGQRVPVQTPVTVYHLLTMSAGFDYSLITDPAKNSRLMERVGAKASTTEVVSGFAEFPLEFAPGERFCYSVCHDILAAVAEIVTGMPFSEYAQKVLFEPLGMVNTTYRHTSRARQRVAPQYLYWNGRVSQTETVNQHVLTPDFDSGGAGIIASPEDYCLFADMMACGGIGANGYRFLKPETVELLAQPRIAFPGPAGYQYGLGVRTRCETGPNSSPVGEFGWDGAAGSWVMMDPKNRISVFLAMHMLNWPALIGDDHMVLRDLIYSSMLK